MHTRGRFEDSNSESGAVLIEFAVIAPLLLLALFAIVEFSSIFTTISTVGSSARTGSRVGATLGDERWADWSIIEAVRSELSTAGQTNIVKLIIFEADASGDLPMGCVTQSVNGVCNHYSAADLDTLTLSDFGGQEDTTCGVSPDNAWCPTTRIPSQDLIGVYVESSYVSVTNIKTLDIDVIADKAIFRLEPEQ